MTDAHGRNPSGDIATHPVPRQVSLTAAASAVLRSGPTSRAHPSSTCVLRLLDAALVCAKASTGPPGSRARCVRACSGSQTAQGSPPSCESDGDDVAFRSFSQRQHPGGEKNFAAQYPAHASPCQCFAVALTSARRMTRRRCGSLGLHRVALSSVTSRRFQPAHENCLKMSGRADGADSR